MKTSYYQTHSLTKSLTRSLTPPQWGAADAEIKVPSGENAKLKRSPFIAWSRSAYSHTYATLTARKFFLAYFYLPVHSSAFFQNLFRFFPALAVANSGSCVGQQKKIGHPAGCRSEHSFCMLPPTISLFCLSDIISCFPLRFPLIPSISSDPSLESFQNRLGRSSHNLQPVPTSP